MLDLCVLIDSANLHVVIIIFMHTCIAPTVAHLDITKLQTPSQDSSSYLQVENYVLKRRSPTSSAADSAFANSPYLSRKGSCSSDVFEEHGISLDRSTSKESGFGSPMTDRSKAEQAKDKTEETEQPMQ